MTAKMVAKGLPQAHTQAHMQLADCDATATSMQAPIENPRKLTVQ